VIREKVTISPERRKLLRLVGVFGKEEKQLKEESELMISSLSSTWISCSKKDS
jgi:hypothetical protein